jgi:hypothetical protein
MFENRTLFNNVFSLVIASKYFVHASKIKKFRKLIEEASNAQVLIDQEHDSEQFLQLLLNDVFKIDPLIWLNRGSSNIYTIALDNNLPCRMPDVEILFKESLNNSGQVFKEVYLQDFRFFCSGPFV